MKSLSLVFLFFFLFIATILAQDAKKQNTCIEQKTCGQCMAAGPHCGWCSQENFEGMEQCDLKDSLLKKGCDAKYIESPLSTIQYMKNDPPTNAEQYYDAVQLSPQEVYIQLRPNGPFTFPVHFRQAENYPVDLYYVMDLSQSMGDDKAKLAALGDTLAQKMSLITKNFRLGFGSFVDKKTMPYVSTVPEKLISPCSECTAPYGFRNQLPLTEDTAKFKDEVNAAPISGNLDSPEGGFDAIMQAIACKNEIGWRDQSRKMLLFSTDAGFHYAGDGKLGGIVTPNDGNCYLDGDGEYSESLNQDYPSISQLAHKVAEKKVNIIFAVTADQMYVYSNLSQFIEGSTVGILANDSGNIVDLVKDNYDKISSSVELKTSEDEDFVVSFKSKCLGNEYKDVAKCDKIGIASNVTFDVTISVSSCPKDKSLWRRTFYIYPVGLNEKLKVEVDLICECGCEAPEVEEPNSAKCNGQGTYECGACTCNQDRYGRKCECDATTLTTSDYDASCKAKDSNKVCSGHGQCLCGKCECSPINPSDPSKRYTGPYCECNNYNCDYENGKICGDFGKCECGKCKCQEGYHGPTCNCPESKKDCMASDGSECNNKGYCECGKCVCTLTNYKGKTCEECPTCPTACDEKRACVLCAAFKNYNKKTEEDCKASCSHVTTIDDLDQINDTYGVWNLCKFRDETDECDVLFKWHSDKNDIRVQKTKECPAPVNILLIVGSVIGGIILIGLILLIIWKVLITIHDRREFARFEKERENAKWDVGENPIYKQATSTYKNPTYNKS